MRELIDNISVFVYRMKFAYLSTSGDVGRILSRVKLFWECWECGCIFLDQLVGSIFRKTYSRCISL